MYERQGAFKLLIVCTSVFLDFCCKIHTWSFHHEHLALNHPAVIFRLHSAGENIKGVLNQSRVKCFKWAFFTASVQTWKGKAQVFPITKMMASLVL